MRKTFRASDAADLIARHTDLLARLRAGAGWDAAARQRVREKADAAAGAQAMREMRGVAVEELNRDRAGIRTKLLRDAGLETVADAAAAGARRIEQIRGIGEDGARLIHERALELCREAKAGARFTLSLDDRSPAMEDLLRALAAARAGRDASLTCAQILSGMGDSIEGMIRTLEKSSGPLRWLLSGSAQQRQAADAYEELEDMWLGSYGSTARACVKALGDASLLDMEAVRRDFASHTVEYVTLLEEILPGSTQANDSLSELPEELALAVREEPLLEEGLRCTLRPYQALGVRYILHQKRVLLGDEMGLGKTVQAIAAMVSLANAGEDRFLVVCPASVMANWVRECARHSTLRAQEIHGPDRKEELAQWIREGGVAVTTYETVGALSIPRELPIGLLVADEAHYVKNPAAKRTQRVRALAERIDRVLFMTGTALENDVDEMLRLIGMLSPETAAKARAHAQLASSPLFRRAVAGVYYRRRREDVLRELPELIESTEWCELCREERAVYEKAVLEGNFAAARRVSWSAEELSSSSKANRLLEIADEAREDGRRLLVFSFFLDTLAKVRQLFGDRCVAVIDGSVPPQARQAAVDAFEKAPEGSVLAAQVKAGGTGLNIQCASCVILCEPQLKPSDETQAISRAYRMGQSRNVLVYRLLAEDTVDERIEELLARKQQEFDAFADESYAAQAQDQEKEISEGAIREMLRLEAEKIRAAARDPGA